MLRLRVPRLVGLLAALVSPPPARATNPLILDQFTADPTVRVFDGRLYLYPSHDIATPPGKGRPDWFCMEDYHVFSSDNLADWHDHGVIVSQTSVPWTKPDAYAMWAPDCVTKNGRYFFYFPAVPKEGKGFRIGVATADHPTGPFTAEARPIEGVHGIDPCVLVDRDGRAYLYYSMRQIFVAPLQDNLLELAAPPQPIANLPAKGLIEGPFVFERNGLYYLTYPHVEDKIERLEYAIGRSPLGPFQPAGVLLDEAASGCWTVHHSIVEYQGEWYLFYHDNDLSPSFDKHRSTRADRLYFNADGTLRKVVPTLRGVGLASAAGELQLDRYSAAGPAGVSVAFLDPATPRAGWKIALDQAGAWVRFGAVDFGAGHQKTAILRASAPSGASLEIRLDRPDGPVIAGFNVAAESAWQLATAPVGHLDSGVHDLIVTATGPGPVSIDWLRFE